MLMLVQTHIYFDLYNTHTTHSHIHILHIVTYDGFPLRCTYPEKFKQT